MVVRHNLASLHRLGAAVHSTGRRPYSHLPHDGISQVKQLPDWGLDTFRQQAFNANIPAKLPFTDSNIPEACHEWFSHHYNGGSDSKAQQRTTQPSHSELRTTFWSAHESTMVPLELTSRVPATQKSPGSSDPPTTLTEFHRATAPLGLLLNHLNPTQTEPASSHSIYLAQCPLPSLPPALLVHLPTPALVTHAGRGDIYTSSLWLGRPPTYTPLHRDPNPNLFLQLAGRKVVRLLHPEVGEAVFEDMRSRIAGGGGSSALRGEEMMRGAEREVLHDMVWGSESAVGLGVYLTEARLGLGEALFIPKGWWHSVMGVGEGVTASANWWFR